MLPIGHLDDQSVSGVLVLVHPDAFAVQDSNLPVLHSGHLRHVVLDEYPVVAVSAFPDPCRQAGYRLIVPAFEHPPEVALVLSVVDDRVVGSGGQGEIPLPLMHIDPIDADIIHFWAQFDKWVHNNLSGFSRDDLRKIRRDESIVEI